MKTLRELHEELLTSAEIGSLLESVSKELYNRNVSAMRARATYAGKDIEELTEKIQDLLKVTDMATKDTVSDEEFQAFRHVLWFGDNDGKFDIGKSIDMILAYLLQKYSPGIDEYSADIDNKELSKQLGLVTDDEGLIEITGDMDLRKHALVLTKRDVMIYPHQFMRRFYSANFVYIPTALEHCRKQGHTVKLRIDPYRQTVPRYYQNIFEADHWHGPLFDDKKLMDTDKAPIRTVLFMSEDDQLQITYPLGYTVFRSDMLGKGLRQYFVEEYVPLLSPMSGSRRVPGIGDRFAVQRFAHFVYDQSSQCFSHIDGAVRIFGVDEYTKVFNSVKIGKDPGKRVGKRRKLFKVSGHMDLETVQNLLYEYFRYNPHLGEYFASKEAMEAYGAG